MQVATTSLIRRAFGALEPQTMETLLTVASRVTYPPNTTLCRQGEIEHTFYVILEGNVAVSQIREDGEDRLLDVLGPSGYFGEMGLIDDEPRLANCISVTDVKVLEVTEEAFDQFMLDSPRLAYSVLRRILATTRNLDRQFIEDLQLKNDALQKAYRDLQQAQANIVEKERLERELELAADVQISLLPEKLPSYHDYEFAAYLRPARQVGGDFYDVLNIDDEHVGILIADVADKGFHSALFMAVTRTLFLQAGQQSLSPAEVALTVHRGMLETSSHDTFLTAFYGVLHRPSGQLTYVRAAQDRPLWYRPGRGVMALPGDGRFLGMIDPLVLEEHTLTLHSGDRLIMYSDGVPDATNAADEQFGNNRLVQIAQAFGDQSAAELTTLIADHVKTWRGTTPQFDDITLLVLEAK